MKYLICLFVLICSLNLSAQLEKGGERTVMTKAEIDKRYQENIKKSRIDGVYIPVDYKEAILELKALAPPEGMTKFKSITNEDEAARKLYYGLGRWIQLNWSFAEGSRLSHSIKEQGVVHQEDMVIFLLVMLHRDLNGVEKGPSDIIETLAKRRKEIARKSIDKVLSTEVIKKKQ